jgi:CBS domain-containing protein
MLNYKAIEIFTSEEARYKKKPIADAVVQYIRDLKIAARCIVTRGVSGCYESGELATNRLEVLSYNLPVRIYIVIPAAETQRVLDGLNGMLEDGIVALHDLNVLSHRVRNAFFPRQLTVRDVMTPDPKSVATDTPLSDAARILLPSIFTGLPVVDAESRPIGLITQGDLIRKGGLPLRLSLLEESERNRRESLLDQLASRRAAEVMTEPVILIGQERLLTDAVDLMLAKGVKRLPVVDGAGRLAGMVSRLDIFRTVMREKPDWNDFRSQRVEVQHLKVVGDILRRDTQTVLPETSIDEVIRVIDRNDIQRVAVVDKDGLLLGLISDRDLLRFFKPQQEGILRLLGYAKHAFKPDPCRGDLGRCLMETTAATVMITDLITVREDMLIEEAIGLMIDKGLKRLPVIDAEGRFKGMINRDSLLRTGYGDAPSRDPVRK